MRFRSVCYASVMIAAGVIAACSANDDQSVASNDDALTAKETIYPTIAGGREWYMPSNAAVETEEWNPAPGTRGALEKTDEAGVFHVHGSPRFPVKSPTGKAWFRNVEVTAYYRHHFDLPEIERRAPVEAAGFQLLARGEAHRTTETVKGSEINDGVMPPPGTTTGPGYPFAPNDVVRAPCLAASMHGYLETMGKVRFKKELSHKGGYTGEVAPFRAFADGVPKNKWIGYKFVVRNAKHDKVVHVEAWIDATANGNWKKVSEADDTGWEGGAGLDGCGAAPFRYTKDQLVTWAGPLILFRFDNVDTDVKALSVREIAPLP